MLDIYTAANPHVYKNSYFIVVKNSKWNFYERTKPFKETDMPFNVPDEEIGKYICTIESFKDLALSHPELFI